VGSAVCAAVGLGVGLAAAVCCLQKQPCALEPLALAVSLASHLPRAPWGYGRYGRYRCHGAMVPWSLRLRRPSFEASSAEVCSPLHRCAAACACSPLYRQRYPWARLDMGTWTCPQHSTWWRCRTIPKSRFAHAVVQHDARTCHMVAVPNGETARADLGLLKPMVNCSLEASKKLGGLAAISSGLAAELTQ
jgi:hypothetical protein